MGVTWYLANDMQFYWYSPIIILPIWYNLKLGLIWWVVQLFVFTGIPAYVAAHFYLPLASTVPQ